MFATIVVCGLIAGSSLHVWSGAGRVRAPVMRGRCGLDMQCAGCGAGYIDSSRGGDGLPALGRGAGSGWKGEPAQTSKLHIGNDFKSFVKYDRLS